MSYEIPFEFSEKVPIVDGIVNGQFSGRFLLDTGAQQSVFNMEIVKALELSIDDVNIIHLDSLQFDTFNISSIDLMVRDFGHSRLYGLLGTREIIPYRVTLDLDRSVCVLDQSTYDDAAFSQIEIFRGRPIVHVLHQDAQLSFILDTGSSCNWLFVPGQEKLANAGSIIDYTETADTAWGNASIQQAKVLQNVNIGGRELSEVMFMQSDQFAWRDAPEDGIIGIGGIISSGKAILDFPRGRFMLIDSA